MLVSSSFLFTSWLVASSSQFNVDSIDDCAKALGQYIQKTFAWVTNEKEILEYYSSFVEVEKFDPRAELKKSKERIEEYIAKRAEFAFKAKVSLEAREVPDWPDEEVNNDKSKNFIRFLSAKGGSDGTILYEDNHLAQARKIEPTKNMSVHPNANFYGLNTSSIGSAVHVPTPLYDRNPKLLKAIEWSEIDSVYRTNREEIRDLAFQMFCSANGFMRYFPAATWFWDNPDEGLDLFDCRNTEWYINAATNSKNMLIMLDMSGSMLGQRYEIAKQTTEAILETLSHNDYFNIMQFSKDASTLDSCNGTAGLLQATMRNKKYLRDKMNSLSAEGKSDYGVALEKAFNLLHNLTETNGRGDQGCTKVIMLITDGAPSSYKEIFDTYNADKSVRVFTFLIGDEAIDFEQVTQMACYNRGYMVHIQNMADVAEKVQAYIRRMSRSVGTHKSEIGIDDPLWSGVYRERLYLPRPEKYAENKMTNSSQRTLRRQAYKQKIQIQRVEARTRMFVTTVSYPVIVNNSFMGVAAVNIPLTEIYQKAHPSNIGARSYFFLLDQNGFVMSHPELRPINPTTKQHKPNYNNMDLLELEVVTHTIIRRDALTEVFCEKGTTYAECAEEIRQVFKALVLNCDNTDPQTLNTLFSMRSDQYYESENVDRVYPQTNTYYTECLKGSNFILGLAVADGDDYRTRRKDHQKGYDYSKVNPEKWIGDAKYIRIHPYWRYCFLNDTDTNITKEEAFLTYAKQMKQTGKLPALCEGRKILVDKLLVDLEASSALYDAWNVDWPKFKQNNIHLVFFAAPSGLIRFYNNTLDDYRYEDIHQNIFEYIGAFFSSSQDKEVYQHFVVDVNSKSSEDSYYRRAVRMKNTIFLDTTNSSKLWYNSSEMLTAYGLNENFTMCAHAFKAIHMGEALLGIAGFEFVYDYVVNLLSERGCPVSDNRRWCVLIDEHGYIFYSNQKGISYEDYCEDPLKKGKHISHWFGSVNRISQRAMQLLVDNKFYTKTVYTDYQAICKEKETGEVTWGNTLRSPLKHVVSFLFRFLYRSIQLIKNFSFYPLIQNLFFMKSIEAYTASFHESSNGYPCAISSTFYLANQDEATRPKTSMLIPGNRADRPCKMNTKCAVKFYASFVEGTNLIMVWMNQDKASENCYDEAQCPLDDPSEVPFRFEEEPKKPEEATCKPQKRSPRSQAMCYAADSSEDNEKCSSTATIQMLAAFSLPILLNLLSILLHF